MAVLLPNGKQSFINAAGAPLVGGKIYTYAAGTNTPLPTYTDAGAVNPNTNPVILDGRGEALIFWIGTYKIVLKDALDNLIYTVDNIIAADFVSKPALALSTGAGLMGYSAIAAYGAGTLGNHDQCLISASDYPFLAKCDGVTDDSDAIQAALDYCSGVTTNRVLVIPGPAYITRPLIVNRRVETTTGEFLIAGFGRQAGFYTDKAIKIFDTTIANGTDPQSEGMKFFNIRFEVSDPTLNTFAFSQDFLRMKFESCYFRKIKCVNSAIYLQDWKFLHCNFRYWKGEFFRAGTAFAKQIFGGWFTNCTWEFGENGWYGNPVGGALIGNLFEGSYQFFRADGGSGFAVTGNYTEGNTTSLGAGLPDYVFTDLAGGGRFTGCIFSGNFMQPHDLISACMTLGDVLGFTSTGNNCNGNLFDMTKTRFGRLLTINDYAAGNKYIGTLVGNGPYSRREVYGVGSGDFKNAVTAFPGGGRGPTVPLMSTYWTIVSVCATAGDSIVLPASDDMVVPDSGTDVLGQPFRSIFREFIVTNNGATNLAVNTAQNDFTNYGLLVTLTVAPGTTRRIAQVGAGQVPVFLN